MFKMKKLFLLSLIFFVFFLSSYLLYADSTINKGQHLFTRTNLKFKGRKVFFHNMSSLKGFIPVGSDVIIKKIGKDYIKFKLGKNGNVYILATTPDHYDKYFTKSLEDVGLKGLSDKIKGNVQNMTVEPGMKKAEVYIAKGCPAFIAYGKKSWFCTLEQIMQSDIWHYNSTSRVTEVIVRFENGVVTKIE